MTKEEYIQEKIQKINNSKLYHYTSFNTLMGILKNKEFWWRSTASMNDKQEIRHFTCSLLDALKEDIHDLNNERYEELSNEIDRRLNTDYPYAMCFSLLPDNAAQWERYANNGRGVCIVFDPHEFFSLFDQPYIMNNEVFYDFNIRRHGHYNEARAYIENNFHLAFSNTEGEIDNLLACATFHKHWSFNSEKEFRAATLFSMTDDRLKELCAYLDYEIINGVMSKVLKINFKKRCEKEKMNYESLFHSIIIGPRSLQNPNELRDYCIAQGFANLAQNISISECPLR